MLQSFEALPLRRKRVTRFPFSAPAENAANGFWQIVLVVSNEIPKRPRAPTKVGALFFCVPILAGRLRNRARSLIVVGDPPLAGIVVGPSLPL